MSSQRVRKSLLLKLVEGLSNQANSVDLTQDPTKTPASIDEGTVVVVTSRTGAERVSQADKHGVWIASDKFRTTLTADQLRERTSKPSKKKVDRVLVAVDGTIKNVSLDEWWGRGAEESGAGAVEKPTTPANLELLMRTAGAVAEPPGSFCDGQSGEDFVRSYRAYEARIERTTTIVLRVESVLAGSLPDLVSEAVGDFFELVEREARCGASQRRLDAMALRFIAQLMKTFLYERAMRVLQPLTSKLMGK